MGNSAPVAVSAEGCETFKVLLLGDSDIDEVRLGVGKSALLLRWADGPKFDISKVTQGMNFHSRVLAADAHRIKVDVFDFPGQERYLPLIVPYFPETRGIALVYDVTQSHSFEKLEEWLKFIDGHAPDNTARILVGNNSGNTSLRQVAVSDGKSAAKKHKMRFIETDFRTGSNVDLLFETIAREMYEKKSGAA